MFSKVPKAGATRNIDQETPTERASLELLYHTSREFASALDLKTVLQRVLYLSVQYAGAMTGSIIVLDEHETPIDSALIIGSQFRDHSTQQLRVTLENGLAGWVVRSRKAALVLDTSQDERWLHRPDDAPDQTGPKSAVSTPILAHDQLVGVITLVHRQPRTLTNDHLELLQAIAGQAGVAIQHAQLYRSLQAAHQRYRELFEDSIDPIFVTDWQGNMLEANRMALRSSGIDEAKTSQFSILDLHEVNWEAVGDKFSNLLDGRTATYESNLVGLSGNKVPIQVQVHRILIEEKPHLQWIFRDITERKGLDRLREDLVSMIYHDLRSPLTNIVSSMDILDTLLEGDKEDGPRALVNIALRSAERIKRLTESLLDVSRLEAGQPLGERQWISPQELLRDAVDAILPIARNKKQNLEIAMDDDLPRVWVDSDMIRRVLINLLENAVKFTPTEGNINTGICQEEAGLLFFVEDTGPGISETDQQQIFNKYSRLENSRGLKGYGLGLSFCRLAVEAHGGSIQVNSIPGNGSRFSFMLPASP